jgi:hypothetical protein
MGHPATHAHPAANVRSIFRQNVGPHNRLVEYLARDQDR